MNFLKIIKYISFFLLSFLLGTQPTSAKTEIVLPQTNVYFSIEQSQSFKGLEKEVQPNIGFLKEKGKFVAVQRSSAVNYCNFSERERENLAKGGSDVLGSIVKTGNKIDNIENGIVSVAKNQPHIADELRLTNGSVTTNGKKFWAQHEMNVTKYLNDTYGATNIGQQITVDIYITGRTNPVRCRIDNLINVNGDGTLFRIADAKSSIINDLSNKTPLQLKNSMSTPNQKLFYEALENGTITQIKPVGNRAKYFLNVETLNDLPQNINVETSIDFYVNDFATDGYGIYKKSFLQ